MIAKIFGVVLFAAVISFVLFEGTKKFVVVYADGEEISISTHANTVADVLADAKIEVADYDKVTPSLDTAISNDLEITWEQAKKFDIVVDGNKKEVWTTEEKVEHILRDAGVAVSAQDKVSLDLEEKLDKGQTIDIDKAFQLTLVDGSEVSKKVWSTKQTVAEFLKEQKIELNEFDRISEDKTAIVKPNSKLAIVRVTKELNTVEEAVDFSVEQKKDPSLKKGEEKVVAQGEAGTVARTYQVTTENGKVVAKDLQSEEVKKAPVKKVVAIGTKETVVVSRGVAAETSDAPAGGNEFYVEATAYTAFCEGCSGITATGIDVRSNPGMKVIAVDPSIIPLGSRVWVEGYGYAIAGDTGGAIQGHIIDLLVPTQEEAMSWGRRQVRIKIL